MRSHALNGAGSHLASSRYDFDLDHFHPQDICASVQVLISMQVQVPIGVATCHRGQPQRRNRSRKTCISICRSRTTPVHASSVNAASTSIEDATATTSKHMPQPTVGKCPRMKPSEYNYTKQMKPGTIVTHYCYCLLEPDPRIAEPTSICPSACIARYGSR